MQVTVPGNLLEDVCEHLNQIFSCYQEAQWKLKQIRERWHKKKCRIHPTLGPLSQSVSHSLSESVSQSVVFWANIVVIWANTVVFFANTVVFWANTVVFWANTEVFWAKTVVFWAHTVVFWAYTVVSWANTVVFWANTVVFLVHPTVVLMLLSASLGRCFVSHMRDFSWVTLFWPNPGSRNFSSFLQVWLRLTRVR